MTEGFIMIRKQTLGWIGASVAAGLYPTFSMSFAAETLASEGGDAQPDAPDDEAGRDATQPWVAATANRPDHQSISRPSLG